LKDLSDAERRTRELAAMLPRTRNDARSLTGKVLTGAVADIPASRTVGGTLKRGLKVFGGILGVLGAVLAVNTLTLGLVNRMFGLVPRSMFGLPGIVLHPLLHASFQHLAMNAVGLVMLGGVVFLRNERDFWRVTVFGTLFGGTLVWFVGPNALHVGASGVVFAYLGYLLTTGWFDRKPGAILLSLSAAALWGSALAGLSPLQKGVSWQLHLFGLIAGAIVASWRRKRA
jgi:membrane associated rhomboid family serine protease